MKKDGVALPASIEKMRASERDRLLREDGAVCDLGKRRVRRARRPIRATRRFEVLRKGGAPVLKNDGAEAWDLGDGVLGLTFKTKANSIDADVIKMIHDAVDARRARLPRAWSSANQGEYFCVGANLFAVVMAAGQKQWDQLARDGQGLPVRDAADEVRDACRSSPRRTA